jgi:C-terminal processing protease CtpA/Prc
MEAATANLKKYYFDRDLAEKMADGLLAHEKRGDYSSISDGEALAGLVTRQMRDISHDMHLELVYSHDRLPDHPQGPTPDDVARYRQEIRQNNCTFEKVEVLRNNIGYLKLNSFPDVSVCRSKAVDAMASLNHADALIVDLRDNTGGYPEMVELIAAYLFDYPEYMYNPRESPTKQSWTASPVKGNTLADKPVYILTSSTTWSGAEQFCYDLKMLKRATLVGETTRGGAHAGVWHRIDDQFGMGIPETRTINPFSNADWEETGVEPDVKVKAAVALETAEKLAESKLQKH